MQSPDPTGSELHPSTVLTSNAGCGLTNHPDGTLYTNTGSGVVNLDANTGAQLRGPFGPGGDALGIAPDPQTGNLIYVGSDGTLQSVNQAFTATSVFSSETSGIFIDGIAFEPQGNFLFIADRSNDALKVIDRAGHIVNSTTLTVGNDPDGIAFKAVAPKFVVTNNGDGTITRFDFPGDDYSQTPTQSLLASGGFRGDLSQVGPDGKLYVTQNGTRFDDGTTSGANSLVKVGPGFAPPPGAGTEGPAGDTTCLDGVDNDGDTKVDQQDSDCQSPEGPPGSASCSDGVDNDGDGQTDAADSGCQGGGGQPGSRCFGKPGTITGNGTVVGTPGDDVIVTGNGADNVDGRGGNDTICTLDGNDKVRGGAGNDMLFPGRGDDNVGGSSGNDQVFGADGNDAVQGDGGTDVLRGQDGNDILNGGTGDNDKVIGGPGSDVLAGNAGANDHCAGDYDGTPAPGTDRVTANSGCETITEVP